MAQQYMKAQQDEEVATLLEAESDGFETESAPSQPFHKKRTTGFLVGLALIGAAMVAIGASQSGPFLHNANIGATVQLNAATSTSFYLIKHEFKEDKDIEPWWKHFEAMTGNKTGMKEWGTAVAKDGFFNALFLPTAKKGPFFCLWEAADGKTKEDMTKFIDENEMSPAAGLKNTVMQVPTNLTGGQAPGVVDFFADQEEGRRLQEADTTSSFYIIEHTFEKEEDVKPWWAQMKKFQEDPEMMKALGANTTAEGFSFTGHFMPTAPEGPFFCLWEAKKGKTKADMVKFINENKLSPAAGMKNDVMEIPLELTGGHPPIKPAFEPEA